jgi:subtilisin family serine protease
MQTIRSVAVRVAAVSVVLAGGVAGTGPDRASSATISEHSTSEHSTSEHSMAGHAGPELLPAGHDWAVTLITGDVVQVKTMSGRAPLVTVTPAPGDKGVIFTKFVDSRGDIEVLPSTVVPLIGRVLDPALFNVTTLIKNGDDDAQRSALPLIIQGHPDGLSALPSLVRGPALTSIGAVAAAEPRRVAAKVGTALAAMARTVVRAGRVTPEATGGIGYVWLDRTVRATSAMPVRSLASLSKAVLDHNLTQIGAPVAWRAGDNGAGVKVAVLDTGVDATFPDLRGQIAAQRNFTTAKRNATDDKFGHGTFVAALIAGTGRAAGGARRGVAFGSKLVIGKVLDDQGEGLESWAIAGMQWAASRARVVNMSFATGPSPGYDLMSHAVDQLSASHHVLFVAAAGNDGPGDETVGSPAAARAALAVGAVDGRNRLAPFSSRGPLPVNFAIKPEVTAPGVNITGARAAGTNLGLPIDPDYTVGSGTSFASPEVAGAAAILTALHPDWSPAKLKADLVSTANPASGGDFYAVGGGVVNIANAISDPVSASTAIAGLGAAPASAKLVRTNVTWSNTSGQAVRLKLSVSLTDHFGHAMPARSFGLSIPSVSVTAHGTATVGLSVRPALFTSGPGLYEGQVVAKDGKTAIRTPVSFYLRPVTHTLTLRASPLPGTNPGNFFSLAMIVDASDPDLFSAQPLVGLDGTHPVKEAKLAVPAGRYLIMTLTEDEGATFDQMRQAMIGQPEVNVNRNLSILFDGAKAVPVTATVAGRATFADDLGLHTERALGGQVDSVDEFYYTDPKGPALTSPPLYADLGGPVRTGTFRAYLWGRLSNPTAGPAPYFAYDLYQPINPDNPATYAYTVTPAAQAKMAKVSVRFYALDGNLAPVEDSRYGLTSTGFLAVQNVGTTPGGSVRTDYVSTGQAIRWDDEAVPPLTVNGQNLQGSWVTEVPGFTSYAPAARLTLNWVKQPFAPGPYSGTKFTPSECAPVPISRTRAYLQVELVYLQDLPDGFDCLGPVGSRPVVRLFTDGHEIKAVHPNFGIFKVPPQPGSYRLTVSTKFAPVLTVSTQTSTTWTFRSTAPAGSAQVRVPLLLVHYDLPLNIDNHPDGRTAVFTVGRVAGTPRAAVSGFRLWTSVDGGKTWQPASVRALGGGRFAGTMPAVASGVGVSLRVAASDAEGSKIDQTILNAYHG